MKRSSRSLLVAMALGASVVVYSAEHEPREPEAHSGISVPLDGVRSSEIALPAAVRAHARKRPLMLELRDVTLPNEVEGLRIFVQAPKGAPLSLNASSYAGSISSGHIGPYGSDSGNFAVEISPILNELEAKGLASKDDLKAIRVSLQPILRSDAVVESGKTIEIGSLRVFADRLK